MIKLRIWTERSILGFPGYIACGDDIFTDGGEKIEKVSRLNIDFVTLGDTEVPVCGLVMLAECMDGYSEERNAVIDRKWLDEISAMTQLTDGKPERFYLVKIEGWTIKVEEFARIFDVYYVSDVGRVWSSVAVVGGRFRIKTLYSGYEKVALTISASEGKKLKSFFVHRLVASAYLPAPTAGREIVNHKNGVRSDNSKDNLEFVSLSENALHSIHVLGNCQVPLSVVALSDTTEEVLSFSSLVEALNHFNSRMLPGSFAKICRENLSKFGYTWQYSVQTPKSTPPPGGNRIDFYSRYLAYQDGRIFNLLRGRFQTLTLVNETGYYTSGFVDDEGKTSRLGVHILIARSFYGPREPGMVVDHKDRVRSNNQVSNLRYVSLGENVLNSQFILDAWTSRPVLAYDPDNTSLSSFSNCRDACLYLQRKTGNNDISPGLIAYNCRKLVHMRYGVYFVFSSGNLDHDLRLLSDILKLKHKPMLIFDETWKRRITTNHPELIHARQGEDLIITRMLVVSSALDHVNEHSLKSFLRYNNNYKFRYVSLHYLNLEPAVFTSAQIVEQPQLIINEYVDHLVAASACKEKEEERFLPLPGNHSEYTNYTISSHGRIRFQDTILNANGERKKVYLQHPESASKRTSAITTYLTALAFVPRLNSTFKMVRHHDTDINNNYYKNLFWC